MKKMFFKLRMPLIIIASIALLSSELFAQEKIDYTQLRGKEWVMQLPDEMGMFMSYSYTVDTCIAVAKHLKKSVELKYKYYLSNDWNGTFDDTKVGVWVTGKYLIEKKENKEKIEDLKGIQKEIAWGSQIRSYVFCPYTLVKDHRTGYEVGNVDQVMNGDLNGFIQSYLKWFQKKEN